MGVLAAMLIIIVVRVEMRRRKDERGERMHFSPNQAFIPTAAKTRLPRPIG